MSRWGLAAAFFAVVAATWAAGGVRYEFYRGELKHLQDQGNAYYRKGDYGNARARFDRMLELVPDYAPAHGALGHLALAEGRPEEALARYRAALLHEPGLSEKLEPYVAYAMTALPGPVASAVPLSELQAALLAVRREGRLDVLDGIVRRIEDKADWCAAQRQAETEMHAAVSGLFEALYEDGQLAELPEALVLAGFWVAEQTGAQQPTLLAAAAHVADGAEAIELMLALGRAYERAGERAAAVDTYLQIAAEPEAKARLQALR